MLTRPTRDFNFIFIKRINIGVYVNWNEHLSNCSNAQNQCQTTFISANSYRIIKKRMHFLNISLCTLFMALSTTVSAYRAQSMGKGLHIDDALQVKAYFQNAI